MSSQDMQGFPRTLMPRAELVYLFGGILYFSRSVPMSVCTFDDTRHQMDGPWGGVIVHIGPQSQYADGRIFSSSYRLPSPILLRVMLYVEVLLPVDIWSSARTSQDTNILIFVVFYLLYRSLLGKKCRIYVRSCVTVFVDLSPTYEYCRTVGHVHSTDNGVIFCFLCRHGALLYIGGLLFCITLADI